MRFYELITEAIAYDNAKFMARWKQEGFSYKDQIGADGENWVEWLVSHDPSKKKSYVNWMITRYISGGINRLEDIPARLVPALKIYDQAKITRKVKPEDADIGKFKKLSDFEDMVQNNYGEKEITSNKSADKAIEQQFFADGEAELVYNTPEWKVVIPKTHAASCYFGRNTKWCTISKDDSSYFNDYSKKGPLHIILQKKTNKRWQFHFESEQFMDENDNGIRLHLFIRDYPEVAKIFKNNIKLLPDNGYIVTSKSNVIYYNNNGKAHRTDGPAIEYASGKKEWWIKGKRHRTDGPAIIYADGDKSWYLNGKHHRTDGPAIERANGDKEWWVNNKRHRTDGPAIEAEDGSKEWYINDIRHRTDGPAIIETGQYGYMAWCLNGKTHRIDGPAMVWPNGDKEWHIAGVEYSEENYNKKIAQMKAAGEI
jgi:hypothetical protein